MGIFSSIDPITSDFLTSLGFRDYGDGILYIITYPVIGDQGFPGKMSILFDNGSMRIRIYKNIYLKSHDEYNFNPEDRQDFMTILYEMKSILINNCIEIIRKKNIYRIPSCNEFTLKYISI